MRSLVLVVGVLLSSPAAAFLFSSKVAFDHPKATQAQFMKDRYQCLRESMGYHAWLEQTAVNQSMFDNCMGVKGYTRNNEEGRLVVPDGMQVKSFR